MFTENHYQLQKQYTRILPTLSTINRSSRILRTSNNQRLRSAGDNYRRSKCDLLQENVH